MLTGITHESLLQNVVSKCANENSVITPANDNVPKVAGVRRFQANFRRFQCWPLGGAI